MANVEETQSLVCQSLMVQVQVVGTMERSLLIYELGLVVAEDLVVELHPSFCTKPIVVEAAELQMLKRLEPATREIWELPVVVTVNMCDWDVLSGRD